MIRIVQRAGDRALRMLLPEREAGACLCNPHSGYQYRCSTVGWQRRRCSWSCDCTPTCGSWVTITPGACPV